MAVSGTPTPSSARLLSGPSNEQATIYQVFERNGVICITVAALISLVAVLYLLLVQTPRPKTYRKTHLFGYILSLLLSNIIQASTTAMNLEWVVHRGISPGLFCILQGGGEQLGNLGMALWSCMISMHMFNLLFLRAASNRLSYAAALVLGWMILVFLVIIGPLLVQTPQRGPYYGISGETCGIRNSYALERVFLEFVLELFSAGTSLTLYLIILLRVRGNLVRSKGAWTLRFIPREESWKLAFGRDLIDTSMLKVAQIMVWYPIAYTIVLLPVAITKMSTLSGRQIPFVANVICSVFFNFTGLLNVLLLIYTQKHFPNLEDVPEFNTPRQKKRLTWLDQAEGVTPYSIRKSVTAEKYNVNRRATLSRAQSLRYPDSAHTASSRSSSDFSLDAMVHEHYKQMA